MAGAAGSSVFLVVLVCLSCVASKSSGADTDNVRAAYWLSGLDRYPVSSLNPSLFTHLIYAFVQLDPSSYQVKPASDDDLASFAPTLRSKNPSIVTLLSIGGGGSNATTFALMASSEATRAVFINSSIALARANAIDGIDLDWEYPQSEAEMANLGLLFTEWRAATEAEAAATGRPRLLLTAAVYYSSTLRWVGAGTYPVATINAALDWVGLMAFDYHGSWEPTVTGAHTALYGSSGGATTDAGVTTWLAAGLNAGQAVLGLASYGRAWTVDTSTRAGVGSPATGVPSDSTPLYSDIVSRARDAGATVAYDNATVIAYVQLPEGVWIGFDDTRSIATKVQYLRSKSMRGYFFWTASYDDPAAGWPLLSTAADTLMK